MRHLLVQWLLVSTLVTHQVAAESSASAAGREQATVHFDAGNEAFARGQTHEAYKEYATAWKLNRAFDIACNLGRAEAELGKLTDAAEHLEYCLQNFSASPQADVRHARQRYGELFRTVKAQVTTLNFRVEPPGATLLIDGTVFGTTPLSKSIYVHPGTRTVELRLDGYRELKRQIPASAGEMRELTLTLQRLELPSTATSNVVFPAEPGATERSSASSAWRRGVLLGGAALTVTAAGVGAGYYLHGRKLDGEARSLRTIISSEASGQLSVCAESPDYRCRRLADTIARRDSAWRVSGVSFGAMGALGLGTLAAWLWWPDTGQPTRQADGALVIPWLGANEAGVAIAGSL